MSIALATAPNATEATNVPLWSGSTISAARLPGAVVSSGMTPAMEPSAVSPVLTAGSFAFTVDVRDDSGIRGLKVLAWPASSKLDPAEAELRSVDSAVCRSAGDTSHCTYTLRVTKKEAAELADGTWYVSALATAKDGDTAFVSHAAAFDVTR